ncbi:MAG: aminopeptidase [Candidatus Eremiobacteraeota bacterium]|nr:aminopeptidase [Candidatus Eremiobacteraeota bacterium]
MLKRLIVAAACCCGALGAVHISALADPSQSDIQRLAHNIVVTSAAVRPGEVVVIEGGKHTVPLMESLAIEAQNAGGIVTMFLDSDAVLRSRNMNVPEKYLSTEPRFLADWLKNVDVYITLPAVSDIKALDAGVSARRLGLINKSTEFLTPLLDSMKYREVDITYPTAERASSMGLDAATYSAMLWNAMRADYAEVAKKGQAAQTLLHGGKSVHITSPDGTDVTFDLDAQRPIFVDSGTITAERAAGKPYVYRDVGIPGGSVALAPVEASANGKVVVPQVRCRFETMRNVTLEFHNGVAQNIAASSGMGCFNALLSASGGPTKTVASFSIGLNPAWTSHEENGAAYYPNAGAGVVYIATGDNQLLGGANKTVGNYGFAFPIRNATVTVDGRSIVSNGVLASLP